MSRKAEAGRMEEAPQPIEVQEGAIELGQILQKGMLGGSVQPMEPVEISFIPGVSSAPSAQSGTTQPAANPGKDQPVAAAQASGDTTGSDQS